MRVLRCRRPLKTRTTVDCSGDFDIEVVQSCQNPITEEEWFKGYWCEDCEHEIRRDYEEETWWDRTQPDGGFTFGDEEYERHQAIF